MNKRVLILGMGISMGLATLAGAAIPSSSDIQASAAEPMNFIEVLGKASGVEIIQTLEQVSKALPQVESTISFENRLIAITAIGVTMAKEDAPAAAAAALNAASDEHKAMVAATAVLISGKKGGVVRRSLLSAVKEDQREAVKSAVDNPRKSVLSKNQIGIATQYAVLASQNAFASNSFYLSLNDASTKGGSGNSGGFASRGGVIGEGYAEFFKMLAKAEKNPQLAIDFLAYFSSQESINCLKKLSDKTATQLFADFITHGADCARCRKDVLRKYFDEEDPWNPNHYAAELDLAEFISANSCNTLCTLLGLDNLSVERLIQMWGRNEQQYKNAIATQYSKQ